MSLFLEMSENATCLTELHRQHYGTEISRNHRKKVLSGAAQEATARRYDLLIITAERALKWEARSVGDMPRGALQPPLSR